ncbi:hypothetical protein CJU90_5301 [Yarrowia sp. C11]|nr:hypothetical protein CJU90_5301 [Yarrowia sp. C11]
MDAFKDFPVGPVPFHHAKLLAEKVEKNLGSILQRALKLPIVVPKEEIPGIIIDKENLPDVVSAIWENIKDIEGTKIKGTNIKEFSQKWLKNTFCGLTRCRAFIRNHCIPAATISVISIDDMKAKVMAALGTKKIYSVPEKDELNDNVSKRIQELQKAIPVIILMRRYYSYETQNINAIVSYFGLDRIHALEVAGFWAKFYTFDDLKVYMDQDEYPKRASWDPAPTVFYAPYDVHLAILQALRKSLSPDLLKWDGRSSTYQGNLSAPLQIEMFEKLAIEGNLKEE